MTAVVPDLPPRSAAPARRYRTGIRVAAVPAGHVYVRHLAALTALTARDPVRHLPDPCPRATPRSRWGWWPSAMLDPDWVRRHHDEFDVFHLHQGYENAAPARLTELVRLLRRLGKPLVFTVHDLSNPYEASATGHLARLDILVPAAGQLITLTPGAAAEIAARWGRRPLVLPYPHVVEPHLLVRPRPARAGFTVGVHLKNLPANVMPLPLVEVLARTVVELPDTRLRIGLHADAPDGAVLRRISALAAHPRIEVRRQPYRDGTRWAHSLLDLDLVVLPYRFGTHSGRLEACFDVGTAVLAPSCGHFAEQQPCLTYRLDRTGLDADSLAGAVRAAHADRTVHRADLVRRGAERQWLAMCHRSVYRALLARA
ncbi:glycosyltransferase family 1 protein [Kitasatospora sp. NPDC093550]|uniref:glycosyltransferase family 1 protein n=1 Tax=Kitasatospora sp. NPDC093550 TaxID=3364089 RepID=UPI003827274D